MGFKFTVSVEQLVKLGEAATQLGVSLDEVTRAMEQFARTGIGFSPSVVVAAAPPRVSPPPYRRAMTLDGPVPA
jgi:hypothetical protein